MKIPRDISTEKLIKLLKKFDYIQTRQTGSHIRLSSKFTGIHQHITISNHNPIKLGTLNNILKDIAENLNLDKKDLIKKLFT